MEVDGRCDGSRWEFPSTSTKKSNSVVDLKFQGIISPKRRGHLDVRAVNVQRSRLRLVITWCKCRSDFQR